MREMFEMEVPEWVESSEESKGNKKTIVAIAIFFVLFVVGNIIPSIFQTISLVSYIVKEINFGADSTSFMMTQGVEYDGYELQGDGYSVFGLDSEGMAKLEAVLMWLETDVESGYGVQAWEDTVEEDVINEINQGNLSVSTNVKDQLLNYKDESVKQIVERYMENIYDKTMRIMSLLPPSFYLVALYSTVFVTLTFLLWAKLVEKRSFRSLGFTKENFVSKYCRGLVVGFILFAAVVFLNVGSKSVSFKGINPKFSFFSCLLFFGGFILQGMNEEVLFRGYLMPRLCVKERFWIGVLVNSALFGLLHIFNAGVTVLAIFNIVLFGIFASLYAMVDDGIAGVCAIHTVWNFVQGNIFGFEVSGNNMGEPLFLLGENRANLINGGTFGAEGGIAVTAVLVIATIIVFEKNSRNSKWIMV